LNGDLDTTNEANAGAISLDGPVILGSDVQINTNSSGTDGNVTIFFSTTNLFNS
jgi:hypothetical protein